MNNTNNQLKSRTEARFLIKGSKTSPPYFSTLRVELSIAFLIVREKPTSIKMQAMYNKCNERKNTSVSNRGRVRVREKAITNIRNLFRGSSSSLYVPAFTAWRISTIHLASSTKELQRSTQDPENTTPTFNLNKRDSTKQWCLQAFGDYKRKPSLYNSFEYRMRNEAQEVCVRENSV